MISKETLLLFWLTLFLVFGALGVSRSPAQAKGWQCMSNLAMCEQRLEQRALNPEFGKAERQVAE